MRVSAQLLEEAWTSRTALASRSQLWKESWSSCRSQMPGTSEASRSALSHPLEEAGRAVEEPHRSWEQVQVQLVALTFKTTQGPSRVTVVNFWQ